MVKRGLILGGALVLFSGVFISNTFAEDNIDFSITVRDAALQLTVPAAANLGLTPTSANADFKSTNLTISVGTNNATGYTLTMSVPSTDISRTGAASGDPVIGTLGSQQGGYSQNDFTVNKWGYKITGDNYFPITTALSPSQWVTDGPANNVDNTITLASKVNTAIPAGIYKTTLTFQAVANSNPMDDQNTYKLIYNPNGGTGTMSPTAIAYGESDEIAESTFTAPEGYEFDGWSSTTNNVTTYYDDGISYTAPADTTGGTYKVLYAIWKKTGTPTPSGGSSGTTPGTTLQRAYEIAYTAAHKGMYEEDTAGSGTYHYVDSWNGEQYQGGGRDVRFLIQDMTPEICASATALDSEALVLDIRDNTSYHIIKARDGRCWMQDNLALDLLGPNMQSKMNNNTNATTTALSVLFNGGRIAGDGTTNNLATSGVSDDWTSGTSFSAPQISVIDKNTIPQDNNDPLASIALAQEWKAGVHYNYCAASAGTYCYGNGSSTGTRIDKGGTAIDAEYDICAKGWRMPTGMWYDATDMPDGGEYRTLHQSYPDQNMYTLARTFIRFPLSGLFTGTNAGNLGDTGYFWTSSVYASYNNQMSMIQITTSSFLFTGGARYDGASVRCIAK